VSPKSDADYVVVIWANASSEGGRPFETMMKANSRNPVAWRLDFLQGKYAASMPSAHVIFSEDDLRSWMSPPLYATSTRESPLLLPIALARSVLGWQDFDFWKEELSG
jgi:hypothetical protein